MSTAVQISGALLPLTRSLFNANWPFLIRCTSSMPATVIDAFRKRLKPQHRTQPKLDRSMVLFTQIIEVFRRSNVSPIAASMCGNNSPWPLDAKMLWGVRRAWHFQRRSETDGAPHAKAKRLQPIRHGI